MKDYNETNRPPMPPYPPKPPHGRPPHGRPPFVPDRKPTNHWARFTPFMFRPKFPHGFNYWCNKVIPLVYDDSLSYYEVLAKTTDYLNCMLKDEKMLACNIEAIAHAFMELQEFVNNYFAWYQSKGIINFEFAITNANYEKYLPDCDTASMNTIYRLKFVEGSDQTIPDNLPAAALPFTGTECALLNLSNFQLKRVGNEWVEITNEDGAEYSTANNYQILITDKDLFFRENDGDKWGEWGSIFGNWWASEYEEVKSYIQTLIDELNENLTALITAETERAQSAESALGDRITAETNRAQSAESALGDRITAETNRAQSAESTLDDKITAETNRAEIAESGLGDRITAETNRAQSAESGLSDRMTAETTRATNAETVLTTALNAEVTRATTAEGALSSRVGMWETDLANETQQRVAADTTLETAIESEEERAIEAETELNARIDSIETDIDNIEGDITTINGEITGIKDGYIPNAGNGKSDTALSLMRSQMSFRSNGSTGISAGTDTINMSGTGSVTIQGGYNSNGSVVEINASGSTIRATNNNGVSISSGSGAISMAGGGALSASMGGGVALSGTSFNANCNEVHITGSGANGAELKANAGKAAVVGNSAEMQATGDSAIIKVGATKKAYYQKGDGHSPVDSEEIATKGDISASVAGYIPNAGNSDTNIDFNLTRNELFLHAEGPAGFYSDDDLTLKAGRKNRVLADGDGTCLYSDGNAKIEVGNGQSDTDTVTIYGADTKIKIGGDTKSMRGMTIDAKSEPSEMFSVAFSIGEGIAEYRIFDFNALPLLESNLSSNTTLRGVRGERENVNYYGGMLYKNKTVSCNSDVTLINQNTSVLIFDSCIFDFDNGRIGFSGGNYIFKNCDFRGDTPLNTYNLSCDNSATTLIFDGCRFSDCEIFVSDVANVTFDKCVFSQSAGASLSIQCNVNSAINIDTEMSKIKVVNCSNVFPTFDLTTSGAVVNNIGGILITGCYIAAGYVQPSVPFAVNKFYNNVVGTV